MFGGLWRRALLWDAQQKWRRISPVLAAHQAHTLLDIGCGAGALAHHLANTRADLGVTCVDIEATPLFAEVKVVTWDGRALPYAAQQFDAALLLTVLHHCPDPDAVLREALRVARTVVVIEDVYQNEVQRRLTYFFDSLFNWQWQARWMLHWQSALAHPRSNRSDAEWRASFEQVGWMLEEARQKRFLGLFTQACYVLRSANPATT